MSTSTEAPCGLCGVTWPLDRMEQDRDEDGTPRDLLCPHCAERVEHHPKQIKVIRYVLMWRIKLRKTG